LSSSTVIALKPSYQLGRAWFALTVALGAHVVDEALTGFLAVYNPIVAAARERWSWFPMPTFTFGVWLTGLICLVILLLALAPLASSGALLTHVLAFPFAIIIGILNGVGHISASLYWGRWAPGTTTAPLLVACGAWLFASALRHHSPLSAADHNSRFPDRH
jgi:hypothetical protein